jgi:hypothetical protein
MTLHFIQALQVHFLNRNVLLPLKRFNFGNCFSFGVACRGFIIAAAAAARATTCCSWKQQISGASMARRLTRGGQGAGL